MYNTGMKKTIITSFIALLLIGAPAFAETKADTATAAATPIKDTKTVTTEAPVLTKKQKIEADLRATAEKLKLVIARTQILIDLLTKNGKDTTDAQATLISAKDSLDEASLAIDQFAGILPEPAKADVKTDTKAETKIEVKSKEIPLFKDPLKKAQDSLKDAKAFLIGSIGILKDTLASKDSVSQ
jgi:hypothetical protein